MLFIGFTVFTPSQIGNHFLEKLKNLPRFSGKFFWKKCTSSWKKCTFSRWLFQKQEIYTPFRKNWISSRKFFVFGTAFWPPYCTDLWPTYLAEQFLCCPTTQSHKSPTRADFSSAHSSPRIHYFCWETYKWTFCAACSQSHVLSVHLHTHTHTHTVSTSLPATRTATVTTDLPPFVPLPPQSLHTPIILGIHPPHSQRYHVWDTGYQLGWTNSRFGSSKIPKLQIRGGPQICREKTRSEQPKERAPLRAASRALFCHSCPIFSFPLTHTRSSVRRSSDLRGTNTRSAHDIFQITKWG